jgi:hypothetical protein
MLNRAEIIGAQDLKTVDVDVPEWGGTVRLRMLSAAERFAVNEAANVGGEFDPATFQTTLIERTAVNEDGTPVFDKGDAAALAAKSSGAISRVFEAAAQLNGLGPKPTDAAEGN